MNKLICWIGLLALVMGAAPCRSAMSRPVGQILNVTGPVELQQAGQPLKKATLLAPLRQGDLLQVRSGGSAEVVLFRNGARFLLSGASTARVEPTVLKPGSGSAPKALQRLGPDFVRRINAPARRMSPAILGVLVRGTGDPLLGPRHPAPNGAVRGEPVTLRWAGPVEGDRQQLLISDGAHTIHQADLPPAARQFRVPKGILRPGQDYVWSVAAVRDGDSGSPCGAPLRILLPAEKNEVTRLEREATAARSAAPDSPGYRLLLAQAYERLGMIDDARSAYEEALRLRPGDPGVQAALKRLAPASHGS